LGYCPNDEKGKAFRQDIKAILKGTGFRCVHKENRFPYNGILHSYGILDYSLYLRPCRGGNLCLSISALEAETLAVGMVLAVRKIHRLHGSSLICK
jgi:hypothetical protein